MQKQWDKNVSTQPIMAIFNTADNVLMAEIVLTTEFYQFTDVTEALKTTMKVYLALNCLFPIKSKTVWTFVQKFAFELPVDKSVIMTSSMISVKNRLLKNK
jgi:hypothetical protein